MSLSSILNHSMRCSSPGCAPAYTVPETCFKSGPVVVLNLAERAFSGIRELRRPPKLKAGDGSLFLSPCSSTFRGTSMSKSLIIWSANLRLSEERRGARGLIYARLSSGGWKRQVFSYIGLLLEHIGRRN